MINVTDKAIKQIHYLIEGDGRDEAFIRVDVKAGGCSGLSYDLSFDTIIKDDDEVVEKENVTVVTNVRSLLYVMDMTLDFSDGINGKGFQFINPNATRTCGCGESFAI